MSEHWERFGGESEKAYHAFSHYMDMDMDDRSVQAALDIHKAQCGVKVGSVRTWYGWSSKYGWVDRVATYEEYLAGQRRKRRERLLEKAQDEIADLSRIGLKRVRARLKDLNASEIDARTIPQWIRFLSDVELKALGFETTQRIKSEVEIDDKRTADETAEDVEDFLKDISKKIP